MQLKIWEATSDKRWHKEFLDIGRVMPTEQQMAELHDYNYLEPPSPALDSPQWQKALRQLRSFCVFDCPATFAGVGDEIAAQVSNKFRVPQCGQAINSVNFFLIRLFHNLI